MLRRSCEVIWLGRAVLGEGGFARKHGTFGYGKMVVLSRKMGSLTMKHLFLSGEND
jgi:hypothetical protein